jgi:hypothetical protein
MKSPRPCGCGYDASSGTENWSVPAVVGGCRRLSRSTSGRYGICRGQNTARRAVTGMPRPQCRILLRNRSWYSPGQEESRVLVRTRQPGNLIVRAVRLSKQIDAGEVGTERAGPKRYRKSLNAAHSSSFAMVGGTDTSAHAFKLRRRETASFYAEWSIFPSMRNTPTTH